MKSNFKGGLPCLVGIVFVVGCVLLAGCADLMSGPPGVQDSSGRVVITIGSGTERTVVPRMDQFSKIVLSFERKNGSGTMSPVEVKPGETLISLSPGTWELTASAYNRADPPLVTAQAKNILTRTGDLIEGNTYFALAPVGTGPGILRYAVAPPQGIVLDPEGSFIKIEKDAPGGEQSVPLSGAAEGELSLDEGYYMVSIILDDQATIKTAVYWETALILPGLVTEIAFAPQEGDFLDPQARAALSAGGTFGKTKNNSSRTLIGEAGGGEVNKTLALSAPNGTETLYFTLTMPPNQTISIGGADAAKAGFVVSGTVDGHTAGNILSGHTVAVFTVDTAGIAETGGNMGFTLTLAEPGRTPIVYDLTLSVAHLLYLYATAWPDKRVYVIGEEFDPAGLKLLGRYSDDSTAYPSAEGIEVEGFDSSLTGVRPVTLKKYGVIVTASFQIDVNMSDNFPVTVVSERRLAFDPDIEADHSGKRPGKPYTYITPPPSGYTVRPEQTLILAPYQWYIPDNAVYEWDVNGAAQASTTEYLSFAYSSFGEGKHTVTVRAKINGSVVATAVTTVSCVTGTVQRPAEAASKAKSEKLFSVVAPGQFGSDGARLGSWNGFGGFGGYAVFKFDHSVLRNGTGGKEIKVGGNTGPWTEPGAIWLSMDENGDGEPNDTWYEAAGSHTFAADTIRRYAVTFRDDYTWIDNVGGGGTYPEIQAYSGEGPELTFVGTRLDKSLVGQSGVEGYADVYDDQRVSISNAVQVDGTPVYLPFVDFVKIVTAIHYADSLFGERSTEAGTPVDVSIGDPDMLMHGVSSGTTNDYNYVFVNESGYDLTIVFEAMEFALPKAGATSTMKTASTTSASVYIDFRGGNVALEFRDNDRTTAYFIDGPAE